MTRIRSVAGGRMSVSTFVRVGLNADNTLDRSGTFVKGVVEWDKLLSDSPTESDIGSLDDGIVYLPDWIKSSGNGEFEIVAGGSFMLSWILIWNSSGSSAESASTYPEFRVNHIWYEFDHKPVALQDTGLTNTLVFPATPFNFARGDAFRIYLARESGDPSKDFTVEQESFLSVWRM
jgi:hypothetical protein